MQDFNDNDNTSCFYGVVTVYWTQYKLYHFYSNFTDEETNVQKD